MSEIVEDAFSHNVNDPSEIPRSGSRCGDPGADYFWNVIVFHVHVWMAARVPGWSWRLPRLETGGPLGRPRITWLNTIQWDLNSQPHI